jgi:hypothetical protein
LNIIIFISKKGMVMKKLALVVALLAGRRRAGGYQCGAEWRSHLVGECRLGDMPAQRRRFRRCPPSPMVIFLPIGTQWNTGTVFWSGNYGADTITVTLNQKSRLPAWRCRATMTTTT